MICLAATATLYTGENKTPNVNDPVKKNIMMQKYQKLRLNILPHLLITSLRAKYSIKK